ncbi:MAG: hypothetical protein ACE367_07885 [Acidimicrobiales bacterium]
MLSSIHPFGERSRNNRFAATATAYLLASIAGAATMALLAAAVGAVVSVPSDLALWLLAAGIALGLAADLGLGGLSVPSWHRQVNERWLGTYRGWVVGLGFGFQLGTGVLTIVTTSAVWSTWLAAALAGSWRNALIIGVAFGIVRGGFILATSGVHQPAQLRALHRRLAASAPAVARLTRAAVAAAGAAAVLTALVTS